MQQLDEGRAGAEPESGRQPNGRAAVRAVKSALGRRTIALVGMMGAGKSSVGRRLAAALDLSFVDADAEIERVADMTIPEIFEKYGEPFFRDREAKVVARLLEAGPQVLATGGGAWMNPETRDRIGEAGVSVWLKADLEVLLRRVKKRGGRPLLAAPDPEAVLRRLVDERYPVYALADITITSRDAPHEQTVADLVAALADLIAAEDGPEPRA